MSDGCSEMLREERDDDVLQGWQPYADKYDQPPPMPSDGPAVWDLVVTDMLDRDQTGMVRYGTRLQPHNGRDQLADAYQEILDAAVYLRAALYERDGK